jgi:hypothetical protein
VEFPVLRLRRVLSRDKDKISRLCAAGGLAWVEIAVVGCGGAVITSRKPLSGDNTARIRRGEDRSGGDGSEPRNSCGFPASGLYDGVSGRRV